MKESQHNPNRGLREKRQRQNGNDNKSDQATIGADMTDRAQDRITAPRTSKKSGEIGRTDQGDRGYRKPTRVHGQRHQRQHQALAENQNRRAYEQGGQRFNGCAGHGRFGPCSSARRVSNKYSGHLGGCLLVYK